MYTWASNLSLVPNRNFNMLPAIYSNVKLNLCLCPLFMVCVPGMMYQDRTTGRATSSPNTVGRRHSVA